MTEGNLLKIIMVNGKEYQFIAEHPQDFISEFYDYYTEEIIPKFIQAQNYQGKQVLINTSYIASIEYSNR